MWIEMPSPRQAPRGATAMALLAAMAMFGATAAWAQSDGRGSALREACAPDYRAYCTGVRAGGGRIAACFRENAAKLSPQCQQALLVAKAARASRS